MDKTDREKEQDSVRVEAKTCHRNLSGSLIEVVISLAECKCPILDELQDGQVTSEDSYACMGDVDYERVSFAESSLRCYIRFVNWKRERCPDGLR